MSADYFDFSKDWFEDAMRRIRAHNVSVDNFGPIRTYKDIMEDEKTAEWADNFFLHELRIAPCEFTAGLIVTYDLEKLEDK